MLPGLQECSQGLKSVPDVSLALLIVNQPAGKQLLSASCFFAWKASFCIISLSLGQFLFLITRRFSCLERENLSVLAVNNKTCFSLGQSPVTACK